MPTVLGRVGCRRVEEARLVEFQLQSLGQSILLPSTLFGKKRRRKTHSFSKKKIKINKKKVIGQRTGCYGICVFGALRERERKKMSRCDYWGTCEVSTGVRRGR